MKHRSEKNGSNNDDWETPEYILRYIRKTYGAYYDPCPLRAKFDGLKTEWMGFNYINPPYTRKLKEAYIIKAYVESGAGKCSLLLLPATTDTKIFHDIIAPHALVQFIRGRVCFKGYNTKGVHVSDRAGNTGSMFVIFGLGRTGMEIITIPKDGLTNTETANLQSADTAAVNKEE